MYHKFERLTVSFNKKNKTSPLGAFDKVLDDIGAHDLEELDGFELEGWDVDEMTDTITLIFTRSN